MFRIFAAEYTCRTFYIKWISISRHLGLLDMNLQKSNQARGVLIYENKWHICITEGLKIEGGGAWGLGSGPSVKMGGFHSVSEDTKKHSF